MQGPRWIGERRDRIAGIDDVLHDPRRTDAGGAGDREERVFGTAP